MHKELKLETLNNGAVGELFTEEFGKVLANINDLNVEPEAIREITIKIKIKPSRDRLTATTAVSAVSKLSPNMPIAGSAFFVFEKNKPKAFIHNPRQEMISGMVVKE